jgi:hypothetical protein
MSNSPQEDDWWVNEHIDNYDWRESTLSNAFVDAMLRSFIRAHPPQKSKKDQDENTRLRDAREAVFGIAPRGHLKMKHDVPELIEMARQYTFDRGGNVELDDGGSLIWGTFDQKNCRSHDALAAHALTKKSESGGPTEVAAPQSSVDRLASKFESDLKNLILTAKYQEEADILITKLKDLRLLLGPTGIPMALPDDPVRDLKTPI